MHTLMLTRDVIHGSDIEDLGDNDAALVRMALADNPLWEFRAHVGEWHLLTMEQLVAKATALEDIRKGLPDARRALVVAMERVNAECPRQIDGPPRSFFAEGCAYEDWGMQGPHYLTVINSFVTWVVHCQHAEGSVLAWRRRPAIEPWGEDEGGDRYKLLWRVSARAVWVPLDVVV